MNVELVDPKDPEVRIKARKTLLWLGIISIIMLFAGLTSAYIVRQGEGKWAEFALPSLFTVSTLIIIVSSLTMQWGLNGIRQGNSGRLRTGLLLTLFLGIGFVTCQYLAWSELFSQGIAFSGRIQDIKADFTYVPSGKETLAEAKDAGNVAGSFLYVITGLHVMHLLAGLIALMVVSFKAFSGRYSETKHNGVSMCAIFWHFLGGLWVYLFLFLLYIR